jgi:hypothetical protein
MKNNEVNLTLSYSFRSKLESTVIPKGSDVFIKLENREILKYKTNSDALPQVFLWSNSIYTKYLYNFVVSVEDLNKISTNKVAIVRIKDALKEGTVDTEDFNKGLRKGAECLTGK